MSYLKLYRGYQWLTVVFLLWANALGKGLNSFLVIIYSFISLYFFIFFDSFQLKSIRVTSYLTVMSLIHWLVMLKSKLSSLIVMSLVFYRSLLCNKDGGWASHVFLHELIWKEYKENRLVHKKVIYSRSVLILDNAGGISCQPNAQEKGINLSLFPLANSKQLGKLDSLTLVWQSS